METLVGTLLTSTFPLTFLVRKSNAKTTRASRRYDLRPKKVELQNMGLVLGLT